MDLDPHRRMERKLSSKTGRPIGELGKTIKEPEFGQVEGTRRLPRIRLRERRNMKGQWALMTSTACLSQSDQQSPRFVSRPLVETDLHWNRR